MWVRNLTSSPNGVIDLQNKELMIILREDVTGGRRQLHNKELNYLYYSPHIIRAIRSER